MGFLKALPGLLTVELTSADTAQTIRNLIEMGVEAYDTKFIGELTVVCQIRRLDLKRLKAYADKRGIRLRVLRRHGLYWKLRALAQRPVLIFGLLALLYLGWTVPGRIYFVEVQGNGTVPTNLILDAAQESGIRFGASRREVRSEKMKNALLSKVPELQWAGVNTYGSRAVITVRERNEETDTEAAPGVSSIVASRDGVILSCTVTRGNGLVVPGQAVKAGQVLISGYTDCGISIEATRAQGDIFARTSQELTVVTPQSHWVRVSKTGKEVKYSLIIGKMRINFFKGSGISGGSCVKMYSEYVLTLPGGLTLPVRLIRETVSQYEMAETETGEETAKAALSAFADRYLRSRMIAGTIIQRYETLELSDAYRLTGRYACEEMIGRERYEEIGVYHGKTD